MRRISSPGAYSLCSVNSIEVPACRLWCMPEKAPSTMTRARIDRLASRASAAGSSASELGGPGERGGGAVEATAERAPGRSGRPNRFEHVADDGPRRDSVRLGVEVGHHAVDE